MKITFRQVKPEDFAFLWQLHNLALKNYVSQVWGWDENHQKQIFEQNFNLQNAQIIVVEGKEAGFLEVVDKQKETLLSSIRLLPEFQNSGIGTQVIQNVITDARKKNHSIRLQVLKINPARRLYERLGFQISGETETHFRMRLK